MKGVEAPQSGIGHETVLEPLASASVAYLSMHVKQRVCPHSSIL